MAQDIQLADSLTNRGCYEVVNAAVVGMSLFEQIRFWNNWLSQFRPDIAVIYPSPAFYLSTDAPGSKVSMGSQTNHPKTFALRLLDRLHSRVHYPDFLQRRRIVREIDAMREGKPPQWSYRRVPEDRLNLYRQHLDSLVTDARAAGAEPILITHAIRFGPSVDPADQDLLRSWARFTPPRDQ